MWSTHEASHDDPMPDGKEACAYLGCFHEEETIVGCELQAVGGACSCSEQRSGRSGGDGSDSGDDGRYVSHITEVRRRETQLVNGERWVMHDGRERCGGSKSMNDRTKPRIYSTRAIISHAQLRNDSISFSRATTR